MSRPKVTISGAGAVGSVLASRLARHPWLDLVLFDLDYPDLARGRARDIAEQSGPLGCAINLIGTGDLERTSQSSLVIETSGNSRKPGISREDLLRENARILRRQLPEIAKLSPAAPILVMSNPLDVMVEIAHQSLVNLETRVLGCSGADTMRFRTFIAEELSISTNDVGGYIIGSHTERFVPLWSTFRIHGFPFDKFISRERIINLLDKTRAEGTALIEATGRGAYMAPAAIAEEMCLSMLMNRRKVFVTCTHLEAVDGYETAGLTGTSLGVPCLVGRNGVESVLLPDLSSTEAEGLRNCAEGVKQVLSSLTS